MTELSTRKNKGIEHVSKLTDLPLKKYLIYGDTQADTLCGTQFVPFGEIGKIVEES